MSTLFTPFGIPALPIQVLVPTRAANDPRWAA